MKKKEFKAHRAGLGYPSVSYMIANELEKVTGHEIRVTVPGHFQRGGGPCPYDRVLSTKFGTKAAHLVNQEKHGAMVVLKNNCIESIPLEEVAGKLKSVTPDCGEILSARDMGISFGD